MPWNTLDWTLIRKASVFIVSILWNIFFGIYFMLLKFHWSHCQRQNIGGNKPQSPTLFYSTPHPFPLLPPIPPPPPPPPLANNLTHPPRRLQCSGPQAFPEVGYFDKVLSKNSILPPCWGLFLPVGVMAIGHLCKHNFVAHTVLKSDLKPVC